MSDERWRDGDEAWRRLSAWQRGGADDAALDALGDVDRLRRLLDQGELAAVRAARRQGTSWAEIAAVLGMSRQSAWEKWREPDDAPTAAVAPSRPTSRRPVAVPELVGLSAEDARAILTRLQLEAVAADPDAVPLNAGAHVDGVVTRQYPDAGIKLRPGGWVKLWIEDGGSAGVREPRRPHPPVSADAAGLESEAS